MQWFYAYMQEENAPKPILDLSAARRIMALFYYLTYICRPHAISTLIALWTPPDLHFLLSVRPSELPLPPHLDISLGEALQSTFDRMQLESKKRQTSSLG